MTDQTLVIYLLSMTLGGGAIFWLLRRFLARAEERRRQHLHEKPTFNAVRTSSPIDQPAMTARKSAIQSVAERFSVFRRLLLLVAGLVWVAALVFPFLDHTPKVFISFLITAATILLGIALKPALENVIAGLVISVSDCVNTGDTVVIDDKYGFVEDITLVYTVIKVWNWQRYVIPNSRMLAKEYLNYTLGEADQWVHVEFWVDPEADLGRVSEIAVQAAKANKYCADYEKPKFWVMAMEKDAIRCWVAAWATSPPEAWLLRSGVQAELTKRFAEQGIRFHRHRIEGAFTQGPLGGGAPSARAAPPAGAAPAGGAGHAS